MRLAPKFKPNVPSNPVSAPGVKMNFNNKSPKAVSKVQSDVQAAAKRKLTGG